MTRASVPYSEPLAWREVARWAGNLRGVVLRCHPYDQLVTLIEANHRDNPQWFDLYAEFEMVARLIGHRTEFVDRASRGAFARLRFTPDELETLALFLAEESAG